MACANAQESLRHRQGLGIDQLQLVTGLKHHRGIGFRTAAEPVDAFGRGQGTVGLYPYLEPFPVQSLDQGSIQLQQGLATGADHVGLAGCLRPKIAYVTGQFLRGFKATTILAISTDKIGITEIAHGSGAVLLATGPKVALAETTEHGSTPGLGTFTLQRVEGFLDPIHQLAAS